MLFEFNKEKSQNNKHKHGIDFIEIQKLWNDPNMLQLHALFENEDRFLNIGRIEKRYWTVITTIRHDKIRIISARRSRKKEIEIYEGS